MCGFRLSGLIDLSLMVDRQCSEDLLALTIPAVDSRIHNLQTWLLLHQRCQGRCRWSSLPGPGWCAWPSQDHRDFYLPRHMWLVRNTRAPVFVPTPHRYHVVTLHCRQHGWEIQSRMARGFWLILFYKGRGFVNYSKRKVWTHRFAHPHSIPDQIEFATCLWQQPICHFASGSLGQSPTCPYPRPALAELLWGGPEKTSPQGKGMMW